MRNLTLIEKHTVSGGIAPCGETFKLKVGESCENQNGDPTIRLSACTNGNSMMFEYMNGERFAIVPHCWDSFIPQARAGMNLKVYCDSDRWGDPCTGFVRKGPA